MEKALTSVAVVAGLAIGLASLAVPIWLLANSPAAGALYVLGPGIVCGVIWLASHGLRPVGQWWTGVLERHWWR